MLRRGWRWCRLHLWQCLTVGFQGIVVVGLLIAISLAVLTAWDRHSLLRERRESQQTATQVMVLANSICEARLDRMQGIYQRQLDEYDRHLEEMHKVMQQATPVPDPR